MRDTGGQRLLLKLYPMPSIRWLGSRNLESLYPTCRNALRVKRAFSMSIW